MSWCQERETESAVLALSDLPRSNTSDLIESQPFILRVQTTKVGGYSDSFEVEREEECDQQSD